MSFSNLWLSHWNFYSNSCVTNLIPFILSISSCKITTPDPATRIQHFTHFIDHTRLLFTTRLQLYTSQPNIHINNNHTGIQHTFNPAKRDCGCPAGAFASPAAAPPTSPRYSSPLHDRCEAINFLLSISVSNTSNLNLLRVKVMQL